MNYPGHENAWRDWRTAMAGARMHHAWLLTGPRGLGKANFALSAARELVGADGPGSLPDILTLTHGPKDDKEERKRADGKAYEVKRNITVAQIRAMQRRLITRPTLGDKRAIIVDPADDMEGGASNALLKSLEEPPQGTFFLLVSHAPARLLPTIRSRCRILRFHALESSDIERLLLEQSPQLEAVTRNAAVAVSNGSPGVALQFIAMDLAKIATLMHRIVREGDSEFALRGQLALEIGARAPLERVQAVLDLARAVLRQRLDEGIIVNKLALADAHSGLVRLSGQAPTYNFDSGLLVMETGSLLARAGISSAEPDA